MTIAKAGGFIGRRLTGIFNYKLILIFLFFILLNSFIIGIQANSIETGLKDFGSRILTPTLKIQESSLTIINNGGLLVVDDTTFSGIMKYILFLIETMSELYILVLWIALLSSISSFLIIGDASKKLAAFLVGVILFFIVQIVYILIFKKNMSPFAPFYAFSDFIKSIPYLIKPFVDIGNKVI